MRAQTKQRFPDGRMIVREIERGLSGIGKDGGAIGWAESRFRMLDSGFTDLGRICKEQVYVIDISRITVGDDSFRGVLTRFTAVRGIQLLLVFLIVIWRGPDSSRSFDREL